MGSAGKSFIYWGRVSSHTIRILPTRQVFFPRPVFEVHVWCVSQCLPLSGPTRLSMPSFTSFRRRDRIVSSLSLNVAASSFLVASGLFAISFNIFWDFSGIFLLAWVGVLGGARGNTAENQPSVMSNFGKSPAFIAHYVVGNVNTFSGVCPLVILLCFDSLPCSRLVFFQNARLVLLIMQLVLPCNAKPFFLFLVFFYFSSFRIAFKRGKWFIQ